MKALLFRSSILVAIAVALLVAPASAAKPAPHCVNSNVEFWGMSGPTFSFCTNKGGVVDTYTVRMTRTYELVYSTKTGKWVAAQGSAVSLKSLNWAWSPIDYTYLTDYDFSATNAPGPAWSQLQFTFWVFPGDNTTAAQGSYNIAVLSYVWQSAAPDAKLAVESQTTKNGTLLGTVTNIFDHWEGDMYHDGSLLF